MLTRTSLTVLLVIGICQSVFGQKTAQTTSATPSDAGLEEIVVTASRREENLQKTSLAIQVLSPDELRNAGATGAKDLTLLVPGLQIGMAGPDTQIYIRGVGDFGGNALANPAVATNVDGVYIARPAGVAGQFYDLARVEVLKGPQGTLYGRNATGGAINIITARPKFDIAEGYANVELGNYGELNTEGAVNLPISPKLALRAAFQVIRHSAYLTDGTDDQRQQSGRLEALVQPHEDVTLLLEADYSRFGGNGEGFAVRAAGLPSGATSWLGSTDPRANASLLALAGALCTPNDQLPPGVVTAPPPRGVGPPPSCGAGSTLLASPLTQVSTQNNEIWGAHAELNADLDFANLTVIPAFRSTNLNYITFPSFVNATNPETSRESTLEVRLGHTDDRVKWVTGAFFMNEMQGTHNDVVVGLLQNQHSDENLRTVSGSAFSEATFSLNATMRLIAGLRYTHDSKSLYGGQLFDRYPDLACSDPTIASCLSETFRGSVPFSSTTWKLGVEHDLTADNMLYVTASTGFKAGGLNDSAGTTVYKPEKLLAFEFGSRNRFFDERLQINLETYYWQYKDQQIPHVTTDSLGNIAFNFENAARARQYGFDFDIAAKATAHDLVHLGIEYLNSRYEKFSYLVPNLPGLAPIPGVSTGCAVTPAGAVAVVDCSGNQLLNAPMWAGTAGLDHTFDIEGGAHLIAHAEVQFASARWLALDFLSAQERAPGYIVDNLGLTYQIAGNKVNVGAFVRNLTNRAVFTNGTQDPFVPGYVAATITDPRTYGVRFGISF